MFGDRHGGVGALAAHQGGRVGGGDDDDGAGETGLAEVVLDEVADFAASLADQGEDDDVAGGADREHGQEGGLADAGAGEEAETLALAAGGEAVEGAHAEVDARAEAGAQGGVGRGDTGRAAGWTAEQRPLVVDRHAEGIDDTAEPGGCHVQHGGVLVVQDGLAAVGQAVERGVGHHLQGAVAETDCLSRNDTLVACLQVQAITDGGQSGEAIDLDYQAEKVGDFALGVSL